MKVTNQGRKLLWLPLNSGDYVSVEAGRSREIDDALCGPALEKLAVSGLISIAPVNAAVRADDDDTEPAAVTSRVPGRERPVP